MNNNILIKVLLTISVVMLLLPFTVFCFRRRNKTSSEMYRKNRVSYILVFSACLMVSVWCIRYAVGYFEIAYPETEKETLMWWEELFNSMLRTFKTFGVDDNHAEYIITGKKMVAGVFENNTILWQTLFGLYASVLNFLAPIAGGAIFFEIIASVFPKIKLHLSHFAPWKEKYYFSKLNSASLALAKSISNIKFGYLKKPIIVFADAYLDEKEEKSSELFLEAKLFGAICLKDDLSHIKKNKWGLKKFFLVDEDEAKNLQTFAEFVNSSNSIYLKKSEIYLFTNGDAYIQLEQRVYEKLKKQFSVSDIWVEFNLVLKKIKSLFTAKNADLQDETKETKRSREFVDLKEELTLEKMPTIIPVKSYRNLISNLLTDIPLYEPLVGKKRNPDGTQDLTVTILGTGDIGTEMFLSAYWFGQILDCNLKINVISQESEDDFWGRIDCINPEIKHTTIKDDPILKINRKGDMAKVYCEVKYKHCDVRSPEFIESLNKPEKEILNTDYFFVALGTDEDNVFVADTIRKYVGEYHINVNEGLKTIITYVVYNTELSKMLNMKKYFKYVNDTVDVYIRAIGDLESVYSANNVFMTKNESFAEKINDAYDIIKNRRARAKKHGDRLKDDYKHWANLSRGLHTKYKLYSGGMIDVSLFDYPDADDEYAAKLEELYKKYQEIMSGDIVFKNEEHERKHLELLHKLAWLEHRRWNAFTRVKGFRHTSNYDAYFNVVGSYKQMDIKLHPCLVECDQKGIKAKISSKGIVDEESLFKADDSAEFDLLDELSYDLYKKGYNSYDFKQYDYPIY